MHSANRSALRPRRKRSATNTTPSTGSPLLPQFSGNQFTITDTELRDEGTWPSQVANAGDSIGNGDNTADLIGNLAMFDEAGAQRWETGTRNGTNTWYATFQPDGNLVVYTNAGMPVWASHTCCNSGYWLAVQEDGNMVIYDGNRIPHWATNTHH